MSLIEPSVTRGTHGTFSPSSPAFFNYSDEQFIAAFHNKSKAPLGTEIHLWSAIQITLGQKCSSRRDIAKSVRTLIFARNYTDRYGLSDYGATLIREMKHLNNDVYTTVKMYVNDCIADHMEPEKELILSDDFRGTCDAINFGHKVLRIYDLKTGTGKPHPEQLMGYAALYCITEKVNPFDISVVLRLYQNGEIIEFEPNSDDVMTAIDIIEHFDSMSGDLRKGGIV
jgi:hypothetical protein